MNDCIFCRIIAGEIPSERVYEDDKMINSQSAFLHSDFLCQFQWVTTYFFARY